MGLVASAQGVSLVLGPLTVETTIPCLSFPSSHPHPPPNTFQLPPHWGGFCKKHFVGYFFKGEKKGGEIKYFIFIYIYVLQNAPQVLQQEDGVGAADFHP